MLVVLVVLGLATRSAMRPVLAHSLGIDRADLLETAPGLYELSLQVSPLQTQFTAPPLLPEHCTVIGDPRGRRGRDTISLTFRCAGRLTAADTLTLPWPSEGVMVTTRWLQGDRVTRLVMRRGDAVTIELDRFRAASGSVPHAARRYLVLGMEHILSGADHLAFVFGLILLVRTTGALIKAITAFTVAHSLTLGLATLGLVDVPPAPVEAGIALSIAFLAAEVVHGQRGRLSASHRYPWMVAFAFGLLHGLGFAGALSEAGLPSSEIPLALLFFNVGVEIGQLGFVAVILALRGMMRRLFERRGQPAPTWTAALPAYAIGTMAMFWLIERSGALLGWG